MRIYYYYYDYPSIRLKFRENMRDYANDAFVGGLFMHGRALRSIDMHQFLVDNDTACHTNIRKWISDKLIIIF